MKLIPKILYSVCLISLFAFDNENKSINSNAMLENSSDLIQIEPPNWWVGLKSDKLQLMVYEPNIGKAKVEIDYQGLSIERQQAGESLNYLFIDLIISSSTPAGSFELIFKFENGLEKKQLYELKKRERPANDFIGFDSSDAIYLITPDRFANGDQQNDVHEDLKDKTLDRKQDYQRHGGDIKGMIDHLDYIEQMGFTAIWPSPLLLNDMYEGSYHGYAITDFYKVDPRFGSLADYKELVEKANQKGIKIIMDQVANHCGLEHWWMTDLPFSDHRIVLSEGSI